LIAPSKILFRLNEHHQVGAAHFISAMTRVQLDWATQWQCLANVGPETMKQGGTFG